MTDTDDLAGWRLTLAMITAVVIVVVVYVAARALMWWWTR